MTPPGRDGRDAARSKPSPGHAMSPANAPPLHRARAPLVLASASPRRAEVLRSAGLEFETLPSDVAERPVTGAAGPADVALRLAALKASTVSRLRPDAVVVGADTVVVFEGRTLGKPSGPAEAAQMLRDLRGREHQVITGVAVAGQGRVASAIATPEVAQRRWTTASRAMTTRSIIVVFSRGPPPAYVTKPWKVSRVAEAASPASRERKVSRPRR